MPLQKDKTDLHKNSVYCILTRSSKNAAKFNNSEGVFSSYPFALIFSLLMVKLHTSFVAHSGNNMVMVYEKHETISLLSPLNVSLHPKQDFAFLMPTQYCDLSLLMSD